MMTDFQLRRDPAPKASKGGFDEDAKGSDRAASPEALPGFVPTAAVTMVEGPVAVRPPMALPQIERIGPFETFSACEIARILKVSIKRVYTMINSEEIATIPIGARQRATFSEICRVTTEGTRSCLRGTRSRPSRRSKKSPEQAYDFVTARAKRRANKQSSSSSNGSD